MGSRFSHSHRETSGGPWPRIQTCQLGRSTGGDRLALCIQLSLTTTKGQRATFPQPAQGNPQPRTWPPCSPPSPGCAHHGGGPSPGRPLGPEGLPLPGWESTGGQGRGEGGRSLRGFQPGNKSERTNLTSKYTITQGPGAVLLHSCRVTPRASQIRQKAQERVGRLARQGPSQASLHFGPKPPDAPSRWTAVPREMRTHARAHTQAVKGIVGRGAHGGIPTLDSQATRSGKAPHPPGHLHWRN